MDISQTQEEQDEQITFIVCVVALDRKMLPKRIYKNFYLAVKGSHTQAEQMQNQIARNGFTYEGERIFPDDIETINLKKEDETCED